MSGFEKYPLPAHAAYCWADANTLWLGLPPTSDTTRGHTTRLPIDVVVLKDLIGDPNVELDVRKSLASLVAFVETLQARTKTQHHASNKIGNRAAPTQQELEALTKGLRVTKIEKKQPLREMTLADLKITFKMEP
jgi:hypothetical protein